MENNEYSISLNELENNDLTFISTFVPPPLSITFNDVKNGNKQVGSFGIKDGKLTFDGDVSESGKIFVDFICESFDERIQLMIKEIKDNDSI